MNSRKVGDPEWFANFMKQIDESEICRIMKRQNQREALALLYRVACENTNWDGGAVRLVEARAILAELIGEGG